MKNLRTDYIDLYYLHRVNEDIPVENVAEVMGRLIAEGLIRGWGMSQVAVETLDKAREVTPVSAVQNLYSMMERDCEKIFFPTVWHMTSALFRFRPLPAVFFPAK